MKREGKHFEPVYSFNESPYWEKALKQFPDVDLPLAFFKEEDQQDKYRSLMHGRAPIVENFKTREQELNRIVEFIEEAEERGIPSESICLVARSKNALEFYKTNLEEKGWDTYLIDPQKEDNQDEEGIRLATMHRVKGLEFEIVIVGSVNNGLLPPSNVLRERDNEISREFLELSERCLLHVASTRARKETMITSYGTPSKLLSQKTCEL